MTRFNTTAVLCDGDRNGFDKVSPSLERYTCNARKLLREFRGEGWKTNTQQLYFQSHLWHPQENKILLYVLKYFQVV